MWKKVKPREGIFPSPRNCVSMEYNSFRKAILLFGGVGMSMKEKYNDAFIFHTDDKTWTQLEMYGDIPSPRYCSIMNEYERYVVLFGGYDGDRLNTVHFFDTETMQWEFKVTNGEIPEKRSHHTACIHGNRLIVFGGLSQEGKRLDDLHVLDLSTLTWYQPVIKGEPPCPRLGHTSSVLNNNVLIVFGGYGGPEGHTKFSEVNLLHLDTMTWSQPETLGECPPGVYAHSSVAIGDKFIVYGGDVGSPTRHLSSDLYIFELSTLKWTKIKTHGQIPPPRSHLGCSLVENRFFIFGGQGEQEKLNDMYYLDLTSIDMFRYSSLKHLKRDIEEYVDETTLKLESIYSSKEQGNMDRESKKKTFHVFQEKVSNSMEDLRGLVDTLSQEKYFFNQWKEEQKLILESKRSENVLDVSIHRYWEKNGRITLNIGGYRYETTISTLVKDSNSLLCNMFSGKHELIKDSDGSYFIDRDGMHFRYILNYLRNLSVSIPPNRMLHRKLLREAMYYQLDGLVELIRKGLKRLEQELDPNNEAAEEERRKGKSKI